MTHDVWQLEDAQKNLPQMAYSALFGEPQKIILRNQEVVILLSEQKYRQKIEKEKTNSVQFINHLLSIPKDDMEFDPIKIDAREVNF